MNAKKNITKIEEGYFVESSKEWDVIENRSYYIDKIIYNGGGLIPFIANPKSGKSTMAMHIALHLAAGPKILNRWLIWDIEKSARVVWFNRNDEAQVDSTGRIKKLLRALKIEKPDNLMIINQGADKFLPIQMSLNNDNECANLFSMIKDTGCEILFVDSLRELVPVFNNVMEAARLSKIKEEFPHLTLIPLTHSRDVDPNELFNCVQPLSKIAHSSKVAGMADASWTFLVTKDVNNNITSLDVKINAERMSGGSVPPFTVTCNQQNLGKDDDYIELIYSGLKTVIQLSDEDRIILINLNDKLNDSPQNPEMSTKEISDVGTLGDKVTVWRHCKDLKLRGLITLVPRNIKNKGRSGAQYWAITPRGVNGLNDEIGPKIN